jgi:nicotinamidase/pyrazinamidase
VTGTSRSALLVVDVQNDFCSGGALAVPDAERVVAALNRHVAAATAADVPLYASRDWHPAVTRHFDRYGGPWPVHCVQDSAGARFHPDLPLPPDAITITKGADPDSHGYSAFDGRTPQGDPLLTDMKRRGIEHLFVGGLATDYCVRHSVLDALAAGLAVTLLGDAIAGVDAEGSAKALAEMEARGARVAYSSPVL